MYQRTQLPQLFSVAFVSNCFKGTIPETECNATTVQVLAMDGQKTLSARRTQRVGLAGRYLHARAARLPFVHSNSGGVGATHARPVQTPRTCSWSIITRCRLATNSTSCFVVLRRSFPRHESVCPSAEASVSSTGEDGARRVDSVLLDRPHSHWLGRHRYQLRLTADDNKHVQELQIQHRDLVQVRKRPADDSQYAGLRVLAELLQAKQSNEDDSPTIVPVVMNRGCRPCICSFVQRPALYSDPEFCLMCRWLLGVTSPTCMRDTVEESAILACSAISCIPSP
jgi:hypothetical protein